MHPRIQMFLRERDRARARADRGVDRSLTADLKRLGVPENATLADPTGRNARAKPPEKRASKPKPRCEHDRVPDRCEECKAAELAEARA